MDIVHTIVDDTKLKSEVNLTIAYVWTEILASKCNIERSLSSRSSAVEVAHNAPVVAREAPTRSDARESHQLEVDGLELGRRRVLRKAN